MLTTKLIRKTFGAKIEPYGFQYKGYEHRIWTCYGNEYEQVLREKGTPDYIVQKKMYINLFGA